MYLRPHLLSPAVQFATQEGPLQAASIGLHFDALPGHLSLHPVPIVHLPAGCPLKPAPPVHQACKAAKIRENIVNYGMLRQEKETIMAYLRPSHLNTCPRWPINKFPDRAALREHNFPRGGRASWESTSFRTHEACRLSIHLRRGWNRSFHVGYRYHHVHLSSLDPAFNKIGQHCKFPSKDTRFHLPTVYIPSVKNSKEEEHESRPIQSEHRHNSPLYSFCRQVPPFGSTGSHSSWSFDLSLFLGITTEEINRNAVA